MYLFKNKFSISYFLLIIIALGVSSCRSSKGISKSTETEKSGLSRSKKIQNKYARLLNVNDDKIDNINLYVFIDEWYGTPYKYGGKNKNGIDCSNFTSTLYNEVYKKTLTGPSFSIFDQCNVVSKSNLTEGDLVFFKINNDNISHIGVYLQNNKFVHATTKKGVMIDDLDEPYYKKYFYKAGRIN
jgi:lipoprotein Spr